MKSKSDTQLPLLKYGLIALLIFGAGVVSGWIIWGTTNAETTSIAVSEAVRDLGSSRFTNPLLECAEIPKPLTVGDRRGLVQKVRDIIDAKKADATITTASVYYRDLNNGPWFGINEEEKFYPASLLKVPLAMYYYWKADIDPLILEDQIEFVGPKGTSIVHFPPRESIAEGKTYSVEDLIRLMLQQSDNDASVILYQFAGSEPTNGVFKDLGVEVGSPGEQFAIDVRGYASFFRILFNATYLGRTHSEHMLELMSQSSFTRGITAGVPAGITVSQKFGEKTVDEVSDLHQLHNCGIVYAPGKPYILCMMTQGRDYEQLADFIKEVSALVYKEATNE